MRILFKYLFNAAIIKTMSRQVKPRVSPNIVDRVKKSHENKGIFTFSLNTNVMKEFKKFCKENKIASMSELVEEALKDIVSKK